MGHKMDIHSPSVAADGSQSTNSDSKPVFELVSEKEKLEAELKALGDVLDSVGLFLLIKETQNKFPSQRRFC